MLPITLDTALNLTWAGIGVVSLILLAVLERKQHRRSTRKARWRRLFAVMIVTVALFPAVSSSDDLFSFSWINFHLGGRGGGFGSSFPEDTRDKTGMQLFRLLETLNHYQVAHSWALLVTLCCLAFVFILGREAYTRTVFSRSGRAPPFVQPNLY
jgi:hypothetical protein